MLPDREEGGGKTNKRLRFTNGMQDQGGNWRGLRSKWPMGAGVRKIESIGPNLSQDYRR
jgi:hypothetical protein